jgi:hypothetical protein
MFKQWDDDDDATALHNENMIRQANELFVTGSEDFGRELERVDFEMVKRLREEVSNSGGPSLAKSLAFQVRKPNLRELGLLYAWLHSDESAYSDEKRDNPAKYWTHAGATGALHDAYSTECGVQCKRLDRHVCELLLCVFCTATPIPLCFCVLKEDGFTIDAVGTCTNFRGLSAAAFLTDHCISVARAAGETVYEVSSLITALTFWRKLGFAPVPAREIEKSKLKDLEFYRPVRKAI